MRKLHEIRGTASLTGHKNRLSQADKICIFLKFCQKIYKKWNFEGGESLKNVKNKENQEKCQQNHRFD